MAAEPADITLVLDFLNTLDVEDDVDALRESGTWRQWAQDRGLRAGALATGVQTRDALRAAVGDPVARQARIKAPVQIELTGAGPVLAAADAVGAVLAAAARLKVLGEWERMKICPADDCRWAFFDHSRNRSRTWCSMQVCGNREKARAWRERTAAEHSGQA
ncbi:CGNR zinc finger domain-containing protein [Amycolatopsis marina]|uniref:CGNR zinc finger domain-containing protein n=1 Tax=Amycolatopsis marina TaxID=490629 RepID=A0A1I0XGP4_9PSEU|nr:CGNR zinc finger domain-containing protein [Amycolatopsis marina]SFB00182.1 CGNR zinc finger domain-containing protein [Amycolatopsis marina]